MALSSYFDGRPRATQAVLYAFVMIFIVFLLSTALSITFGWFEMWHSLLNHHELDLDGLCYQPAVLDPPLDVLDASQFLTKDYKLKSAEYLGGAVQIPTESFDDMDEDPKKEIRFKVFRKLHSYLRTNFPTVSKHLETVNTYGLLYTLEGTDPDLEPVVLMAHQDVVPVERQTLDKWTHGAFSGYFDGKYVWGRGSHDTKSSLVAILEAAESLLSQNWQPKRTVLISFGFDEELDGSRGALQLANTIRRRYGHVDMIIDEGSSVTELDGHLFGLVSVSEKGYTDINVIVETPGGHSSAPPDHTGIGILAELIVAAEKTHNRENQFYLNPDDIVAAMYGCVARFGDLDDRSRQELLDVDFLRDGLQADRYKRPLISTTQAVDVIDGGVKINALPEQASAILNYRIDVHETVGLVTNRLAKLAEIVAKKYGLGVEINGENVVTGDNGLIKIVNGQSMEPAPVSPFDKDSRHWQLLAGTTKHALQWFGLDDVAVSPTLSVGNTDTWQYAGLTQNVYRYTVGTPNSGGNAHTVDEYISLESHLAAVVWYYEMMQFF